MKTKNETKSKKSIILSYINNLKQIIMKSKLVFESFIFYVIIVISMWLLSWHLIDISTLKVTERGLLGDQFGLINSLFSGLAFAGIVYSINIQKKELNLQRNELKESRKEFQQQNFENTFFNLLEYQNTISDSIETEFYELNGLTKINKNIIKGKFFFRYCKIELKKIIKSLESDKYSQYDILKYEYSEYDPMEPTSPDDEQKEIDYASIEYTNYFYNIDNECWNSAKSMNKTEIAVKSCDIFVQKYIHSLGHYYRNFYHILKFIDDSRTYEINKTDDKDEINYINNKYLRYGKFVQAQMSSSELLLLFYNCLNDKESLELVKQYNILEELKIGQLLDQSHVGAGDIKLKSV